MPQLHLYVSDTTADVLRADALEANLSLSRYMAKILTERTHAEWPKGYLTEAFGSCPGFDVPTEPPYVHAADLRGESR
jgi:hypothetical protein